MPVVTDPHVLVGALTRDDAAVYRVSDDRAIVATVDFFTPIVDDAFAFGAIAAANALSDLYAMGAQPLFVLNLVGWPRDPAMLDLLGDAVRGITEVVAEAGAFVLGGHSIDDQEPKLGLVAIGDVHPDAVITNAGARPGDALLLTKPLGTGILSTALKSDAVDAATMDPAITSMRTLNAAAAKAMRGAGDAVHAATDVSGFGLLGHLSAMLLASGVGATIFADRAPKFDGVLSLIDDGFIPGGTDRNRAAAEEYTSWGDGVTENVRILLADAQTSGGLLIAVAPARSEALLRDLEDHGVHGATIGAISEAPSGHITVKHHG